jgi:FkbM family methyltransferase
MYSTEDLRATLGKRLEAFARSGRSDWRVLEDADTRDVSLDGVPVILMGMGSKVAQPFVERCLARARVSALIDNGMRGGRRGALTVEGDDAYAAAAAAAPGGVDVICAGGVGGMAHFDALASGLGRRPIHLFQAMRRLGMAGDFGSQMWLEYADPALNARVAEARDLGPLLADELSRRTYYALLLYRLSWSGHWLEDVRQPCADMYFKSNLFPMGRSERLVDGGAYTGDSIADFLAATGGSFGGIEAFEPDRANFDRLAAAYPASDRVRLHRAGLWSSTGRVGFAHEGQPGSSVSEGGADAIDVIALDDIDMAPTLIKLDVEGAEMAVLKGARRTIARHRPRLAVSVYHRVSHMWDVAAFLGSLGLGYRFGLRHYSGYLFDTILYAY